MDHALAQASALLVGETEAGMLVIDASIHKGEHSYDFPAICLFQAAFKESYKRILV